LKKINNIYGIDYLEDFVVTHINDLTNIYGIDYHHLNSTPSFK